MTYSELKSMKLAALDNEKEYNKKWAKINESMSDVSTLWLDFVAEDHSQLADVISLYVLPNLSKIVMVN